MIYYIQPKALYIWVDIICQGKMANTKSIQKVLDYLKTKDEAVSPSEICFDVVLRYKTVKDVLEVLKMNNRVIILTTGRHTLVQLKKGDENAG